MLVKLKDLRVGDEILVPVGSQLRCLKVLRAPKPRFVKAADGSLTPLCKRTTNEQIYSTLLCSVRMIAHKKQRTYGKNVYEYVEKEYFQTFEDHNCEQRYNLNYKDIWLVN
jgi:hypothetical protein